MAMAATVLDTIEYIVLLVTQFASGLGISESEAYGYLCRYGAIDLCEKHHPIMHTLPLRDNIDPAGRPTPPEALHPHHRPLLPILRLRLFPPAGRVEPLSFI